ncbi:MAG: diguanylate cyclase [Gammaproteobacteria bacterium]|nr:diguanylate cyclase [Gammaproteobacteria bacterium]
MTKTPANSDDVALLRQEIERLNKVVAVLTERSEDTMNAKPSDFSVFESTIILEDQVRTRTQELEEALHKNEKITRALQQAKMEIELHEKHLHDITASLGEGLLVVNSEGIVNFINAAACKMLGWREDEVLGKNGHSIFHRAPNDNSAEAMICSFVTESKNKQLYTSDEEFYWHKDGTKFPISVTVTPISFQNDTTGAVIAFRDITKEKQERDWLRLMQAAIEYSPSSVMLMDTDAKIIYSNPQVSITTGYSREELYGRCTSIFQSGQSSAKDYDHMWKTILSGNVWTGELLDRRKDGSLFWEALSVAPVTDEHGVINHFVAVSQDNTEKKKMQTLLQEMSFHDSLTEIANRRRFDDYFDLEWRRAKRKDTSFAIIMADIDFFKLYNDSLGHQAGDQCLKKVAQAMKNKIIRSGDLLARYGGEEFVCLLPETDLNGARHLAEILRLCILNLKIPHPNSSVSKYVTISLGVAAFDSDKVKSCANDLLLRAADDALYVAKSSGRNCVKVSDSNSV